MLLFKVQALDFRYNKYMEKLIKDPQIAEKLCKQQSQTLMSSNLMN